MGFLGSIFGAAVKTVLTPVAILKDVANVATGQDATATENLISGVVDDLSKATDDLCDGEL